MRREASYREDLSWPSAGSMCRPAIEKLRALTFWAAPRADGYYLNLPIEEQAIRLARAAGHIGTSAEYLYNTICQARRTRHSRHLSLALAETRRRGDPSHAPAEMTHRETLKGILLLVASVSLFGLVDGLSKVLVETQSFGQIMLARYGLALPLALCRVRLSASPPPSSAPPGLACSFCAALAPLIVGGAMVFAVRYLPLAEATVILFAGPFMVVALSGPLLGERVGAASWVGVVLGFIAVIMVARPGFSDVSVYAIFPLVAALFYAVFQMLTRHLSTAAERTETTLAWTLAIGLVVSLPLAIIEWVPVSATAWALSIALSLIFAAAQLLLVRAYDHASANVLAPFSYVQIIAATLFGLVAFGDVPDLWTLIGIVLIIAAGVYVMRGSSGR